MQAIKNLVVLNHIRTGWVAFGFYCAWLVVGVLLGALVGAVAGSLSSSTTAATTAGLIAGNIVAIALCTGLSYFIAKAKGMVKTSSAIYLIIATVVLAALGGGFLGLIIPAYMTTRVNAVA